MITTICYGQQALSEAIKANSRFFITIYAKGELLYSRDGMGKFDFNTQFIPIDPVLKARNHFEYRIPLAKGFLRAAAECLGKQNRFNSIRTSLVILSPVFWGLWRVGWNYLKYK